jgi:hypothetical protein
MELGPRPSLAQWYQAVSYFPRQHAEREGLLTTANLVVRRSVFETLGDSTADCAAQAIMNLASERRSRSIFESDILKDGGPSPLPGSAPALGKCRTGILRSAKSP